nr:hypothetical protein [Vibrio parahaemolyticus]
MSRIKMLLNGGISIAQYAKRNHFVRARLMFDEGVNIASTNSGLH